MTPTFRRQTPLTSLRLPELMGVDRKTLHAKASIAKLSASEAAGRVVDRCRGYDRSYPIERMYREVRVDRIGRALRRSSGSSSPMS